jgi:hypothetical protein
MVPVGDQVRVAPDARMDQVMGKLQDSRAGRVLVVQGGEVVGDHHPLGPDQVAAPMAGAREQTALSRQLRSRRGPGWGSG